MATKITLNNSQLTENDAGAVVGTLTISDGTSTPLASLSLSGLNGSNGFRLDGVWISLIRAAGQSAVRAMSMVMGLMMLLSVPMVQPLTARVMGVRAYGNSEH